MTQLEKLDGFNLCYVVCTDLFMSCFRTMRQLNSSKFQADLTSDFSFSTFPHTYIQPILRSCLHFEPHGRAFSSPVKYPTREQYVFCKNMHTRDMSYKKYVITV